MSATAVHVAPWDLWVDYQRCDSEGLTHADVRHARVGLVLQPGTRLIVGNEDADLAYAEVVRVQEGIAFLQIFPERVTRPSK